MVTRRAAFIPPPTTCSVRQRPPRFHKGEPPVCPYHVRTFMVGEMNSLYGECAQCLVRRNVFRSYQSTVSALRPPLPRG